VKHTFDIIVTLLALIILFPVLLIIALLVKITSPGPIFYKGERVGKDAVPFKLIKFRSMTFGADKDGPKITASGDVRVTPLGRWLRRLKLDELPQFLNVLKGEMSLVGPRPEDPRYLAYYSANQKQVLNVLPGITSAASVRYRHEEQILSGSDWETTYIQEILPHKLNLELQYLKNPSFLADLKIISQTFLALFR